MYAHVRFSPDACHIKWPYSGKEKKLRETINNYFLVLSYRQQLRKQACLTFHESQNVLSVNSFKQ